MVSTVCVHLGHWFSRRLPKGSIYSFRSSPPHPHCLPVTASLGVDILAEFSGQTWLNPASCLQCSIYASYEWSRGLYG